MSSGKAPAPQRGFTYLVAMFAVAIAGLLLAAGSEVWSHSRQREMEKELLFVGGQFREAIGLYYQRTPGAVKRYPEKLEELLDDRRYLSLQRHLRKIYADPMTGKKQWGTVGAPGGGIMGVYSLSSKSSIKSANFDAKNEGLSNASSYSGWRFIYEPPPDPVAATKSGAAGSGAPPKTGIPPGAAGPPALR
jgi:type II secretory pathway pseudopilin PulG